jgi:hypothetical protein
VQWVSFGRARLVDAHRWHLACEFSNWIEAASAAA